MFNGCMVEVIDRWIVAHIPQKSLNFKVGKSLTNGDDVTLEVQNPGGTENLEVTYTIFSKQPIERVDVETDDLNYQIAQVC